MTIAKRFGWLGPGLVVFACGTEEGPAVTPSDVKDVDGGGGASIECGRSGTLCDVGAGCEGAPDCASGVCRDGVCGSAVPKDDKKNHDETDIDCGGAAAP